MKKTTRTEIKTMNIKSKSSGFIMVLAAVFVLISSILFSGCVPEIYAIETSVEPMSSGYVRLPSDQPFEAGTSVQITAVPAPGYRFDYWSGDLNSLTNPVSLTLDSQKKVTAHFKAQHRINGNVKPAEGGVIFPSGSEYDEGALVTVTATPAPGYRFDTWSGDVSGKSKSINLNMDRDRSVTANFVQQYSVTAVSSPENGGVISPPDAIYDKGSQVNVRAIPAKGYRFSSWSGDAEGNSASAVISINSHKKIVANFAKEVFSVTTSISPLVTPTAGKITLSPDYNTYDTGTPVTLTATPAKGYEFERWAGDYTGTSNPITFTMDKAKSINAIFKAHEVETELTAGQSKGLLSASASGLYLTSISLSIVSKAENPLKVNILPGTIFTPGVTGTQKMVVTHPLSVLLQPGATVNSTINVACMNMYYLMPGPFDTLTLSSTSVTGDLKVLLDSNTLSGKSWRIRQFAVWTITDNPWRDKYVRIGSDGIYTSPTDQELAEIKALFQELGISTGKYAAMR
jgi:hypothetical protein